MRVIRRAPKTLQIFPDTVTSAELRKGAKRGIVDGDTGAEVVSTGAWAMGGWKASITRSPARDLTGSFKDYAKVFQETPVAG
jgi:hypothetical protein